MPKRKNQTSSHPDGWHDAGHVMPIQLTKRQEVYARRAIGIARFSYNLCVATHQFCRNNRLQWPSWQDLSKALNAAKKDGLLLPANTARTPTPEQQRYDDISFLNQVSYRVVDGAVQDFGQAIANWRDPALKARKPTFKKRRLTGTGSFKAAGAVREIKYGGKRRIRLPYLGSVKLAHTLPKGIIHEARIKFKNGQWTLSVNYWKPPQDAPEPDTRLEAGAADTGINPAATDSEGQTWENPKAYYQAEKRLCRWQRAQARRATSSRGWWEAQRRIDHLHRRIANLRKHAQHLMTSQLVHKYLNLVIEDLHVNGLMQGPTPKVQADAGMGEIKRQIIYKGQWHHCNVYLAPRSFPSSKLCSFCHFVNAKLKRERYWQCPTCTIIHERNENAAVNLRNLLTLPGLTGSGSATGRLWPVVLATGETTPDDRRTVPPYSGTATLIVSR